MDKSMTKARPEIALIQEWWNVLQLEKRAGEITDATMTTYQRGMTKFWNWCDEHQVDQVTSAVIQQWKADLLEAGIKPSSVNVWLAGVKRFFDWAVNAGSLAVNPAAGVKSVKRRGTHKNHLRDKLSDREVLRVLSQPDTDQATGRRDLAMLSLMAFCALRTIELHRADLEDLTTIEGMPVLRIQGKGSSEKDDQAVIYHPKAQDALYDWLAVRGKAPGALFTSLSNRSAGSRLGTSAIRHIVVGYYRMAGIIDPRKTTHSLRHSAISKVASHNIMKAKQVARHSSIDTTLIYVHQNDRLDNPGEQFIDYQNGNNGE